MFSEVTVESFSKTNIIYCNRLIFEEIFKNLKVMANKVVNKTV
ncbi:hypothetical protein CLCOL_20390 [Clostridium colicanis DSM 13634]|uniref:Uncharacterized protein n=1 Tax=Clostridium colicanis DSM 13634 TaxID=1121305 RepID=A0A151AL15_9CLOT|nr:hypothetical protein CLCOL_20390 [Clostridium colicanis DSM 13634]